MEIMVFNEIILKRKVLEAFGLNADDVCSFAAGFEKVTCLAEYENFQKDTTYHVWLGHVVAGTEDWYFIATLEGDIKEIPRLEGSSSESFSVEKRPLTFMHTDGQLYVIIYNSQGIQEIIPLWHLDLYKVKENGRFGCEYPRITGKFEYIGDGKNTFFAWVFYAEGKILKVFNIENGQWSSTDETVMRLSLEGNQFLKDLAICQKSDFVQIYKVSHVVGSVDE